jgi:transcriptional regulator with XRE-family HTH domain
MRHARRYCRCGTLLARDNTASLCSPCQGKRQGARAPAVPPEFWHTDAMAAALDDGDLGCVLRAYRFHPFHGQPLPQCIVARWLHVSQATLSRIESGHRRLTVDEIAGFAQALGHSVAIRWTPLHDTGEDVDPLSRRSLLGAGVGAALGLNATTAPAATRQIDPALVEHWMNFLHVLRRHDAAFGPHDVLPAVRRELGLIAEHRRVARGDLHTQLLGVESRWSWSASWLGRDAGDARLADEFADRARRLAHEADYPDMIAYALMRQSLWAAPEARKAMMLADTGSRTPGASPYIRSLCALRVAYGHALAGDTASCERSLADADRLLPPDHAATDAPSTPWEGLGSREATRPYVLAEHARCWLRLQPRKAVTTFEDVLRLWPGERTRGRGIHQAHLALACAAANEPDRAASEGLKALDIAHATRSHVTMRELKRLDRRLAACDTRAAGDFREALAAA